MTKYINWYFFGIYNYYALGKFIANKLPSLGFEYPLIGKLLVYHSFINFCLFMIGFLWFVLTLKQGYLKYQFRLFGWILISTVLVCTQAWFMCSNIF
jgi:phosphatidate cytidylyltransferase